MKKKLISILLACLVLSASLCPAFSDAAFSPGETAALDYLAKELQESSEHLIRIGEDVDDIYSDLVWISVADTFPAKFDLRERGTVTPVKSQSPWGTCWSFATTAASETSILNSLGLTTEAYQELYGEALDLSEKHLAWFTAKAMPKLSDYPEGEYPYDPSQAEEGLHLFEGTDTAPLNLGGNYYLSSASLASGIGILKEKYAPYADADGQLDAGGDWSLPEDLRFAVSFELKDANILPAPSSYDENGNYIYRPEATEMIKTELMKGRAVGISFMADQSMPEMEKDELRAMFKEDLRDYKNASEEEKAYYIDVRVGDVDMADLSEDKLRDLIRFRLRINNLNEDTYDLASYDHDQLAMILMSRVFSNPYETILEHANQRSYMSFVGKDPVIYAQYTDEAKASNHAVTVVGWDDSFSAENWPEGHRPPGDGVWIVKNSWGTDWGNDGYFLLSYFDMTLCAIESFEYVVSEDVANMDYISILEHDYMPSSIASSTLFDTPVCAANVFSVYEDSVLQYISVMTGDLNTSATASIYLLYDDAASPTDGLLLDSVTESFLFAGYHRINLSTNLLLRKGSRIGIVISARTPVEKGSRYALVNNSSLNEEGVAAYNKLHASAPLARYAKAVVNPGESYVSFEPGRWIDWSDVTAYIGNVGSNRNVSYDNLPIKAYIYPLQQVKQVHDLSNRIPAAGGEAAICPEDGYLLLDAIPSP